MDMKLLAIGVVAMILSGVGTPACAVGPTAAVETTCSRYSDGTVRTCAEHTGSVQHGEYEEFHPNGERAVSGSYRNGVPHGVFTRWDEQGNFVKRTWYERGEVIWSTTDPEEFPPRAPAEPDEVRVGSARPLSRTQVVLQLGSGRRSADTIRRTEPSLLEPASEWAFSLDVLLRRGSFFAGPAISYALKEDDPEEAYLGVAAGWLRAFAGRRLSLGFRVEAGGHHFRRVGEDFGIDPRNPWRGYAGLGMSLGLNLTRQFALAGAFRWRRDVGPNSLTTTGEVCSLGPRCIPIEERWEIGGDELLTSLYLRLVAR